MQRKYLLIFLFFWAKISLGQVVFSVEVLEDSMQIGDVNTYRLKISHPAEVTIRSIDLKPLSVDGWTKERFYQDTSITNHPEKLEQLDEYFRQQGYSREVMEIKNYGNWKAPDQSMMLTGSEANWTTQHNGNTILKENDIQFIFWEEGLHKILPPVIEYEQNGALKKATAQVLTLQVGSPLPQEASTPLDSLDVQPLKDKRDEPINWVEDVLIPLGLFLLGVLLLGGLIYWFFKKSKKPKVVVPKPKEYIAPSTTALQQLKKLKEKQLWQKGEIKAYQSELTHIIRLYLENRFGINALENTTHQIGLDLKSLNLSEALREELQNILQVADLVKFAKAKPTDDIHEQFMTKAEKFINTTKKTTAQIEAEKAAIEAEYQRALEENLGK